MLVVLSLAALFFLIGFFAKSALDFTLAVYDLTDLLGGSTHDDAGSFRGCAFFDPVVESIGLQSNDALQAIFDIIIERYVLAWYRTLSGSADFPIQARMYLQYLSSTFVHRLKSVKNKADLVERLLKLIFGHIEHIMSVLQSTESVDTLLEDSVIRGFGSHLHIAMASRATELAYLRALVSRLLPYVSLPPGLLPPITTFQDAFDTLDQSAVKQDLFSVNRNSNKHIRRSSANPNTHLPCSSPSRTSATTSALFPLGANRAAYSLLVEILSTCVLLPAMDAVANPDFINKIILQCLNDQAPLPALPPSNVTHVPVLNSYVQEWRKWLSEKSIGPLHLKDILQQQEEFHSFMQYMKSIRSTAALTTVLLMNDVDQRIRGGCFSADTFYEVCTQVRHILHLIHGISTPDFGQEDGRNNDEVLAKGGDICAVVSRDSSTETRSRLFGLPDDFAYLLVTFLNKPRENKSLIWLTHKSVWKNACTTAFEAVERRFLPLYIESPEYLSHIFGIAQRGFSTVVTTSSAPKRNSFDGSSLFGIPLPALFSPQTVEGRLIQNLEQDTTRPVVSLTDRSTKSGPRSVPLRDRATEALNTEPSRALSGLSADSQHQLHARYLLHSHQIDMSDWHVFIPGLCRPEVQPGRRLIDHLVPTAASPLFSQSARVSEYSARPHDATFKAKIMNELNSLQSGPHRQPQLSSQFMYTVRTERIVNGSRHPIARVARKYSEFYVLEQKLIEFHGSAIVRQLPKKQLIPRTFEYLESKREMFEDHLQYLLSQPFLRSSELLHGFLTSKTTFSNNILFELNLGRFAKSVPLKLAKEKGQFLDSFLVAFYISCNPQPISVEHVDLRPSEPIVTVLPSSGVGTLGGIDAMVDADHYVLGTTSPASTKPPSRAFGDQMGGCIANTSSATSLRSSAQKSSGMPNATAAFRSLKRTWLDNRLRAKAFWNNASLSMESKIELYNTPCDFMTVNHLGLCELLFCVFEKLIDPRSPLHPTETVSTEQRTLRSPSSSSSSTPCSPDASGESPPVFDPWDVSSAGWSEAILNGPLPHPLLELDTTPLPRTRLEKADRVPPQQPMESQQIKPELTDSPLTVSITLADLGTTLNQLVELLSAHFVKQVRHLLLWTAHLFCKHFSVIISHWLAKRITAILLDLLSDENLAYALQLLKATLFYPYTPSTDSEKNQRKLQAHASLRRFLLDHPMAFVFNRDHIEDQVDQLFHCLQHPKWNKQLTYVLLDQLVTDLFPELQHDPRLT